MFENGLIHIYYGNGKGKTTAALGLALRAAGCGNKVVIVQFLKERICGEHKAFAEISNVMFLRGKPANGKFVRNMSDEEKQETKASQDESLKNALELVKTVQCDMLILDEVIDAYNLGVLDKELLDELLERKPDSLELVITGHNPDAHMLEKADYATEMVKRKHPYDEGVYARQGVEF